MAMDDAVASDFRPRAEVCAMKDRRAGRDEDLLLHATAHQVRMGSDQTVVTDLRGMAFCTPNYRVFQDDATFADVNSSAFGNDRSPVHDPAVRSNDHVGTDWCSRRDVGTRIHARAVIEVRQKHLENSS